MGRCTNVCTFTLLQFSCGCEGLLVLVFALVQFCMTPGHLAEHLSTFANSLESLFIVTVKQCCHVTCQFRKHLKTGFLLVVVFTSICFVPLLL